LAERRLKRPRDPIQLGELIVDIATGQAEKLTRYRPAPAFSNPEDSCYSH
jgi:hypothetical protein